MACAVESKASTSARWVEETALEVAPDVHFRLARGKGRNAVRRRLDDHDKNVEREKAAEARERFVCNKAVSYTHLLPACARPAALVRTASVIKMTYSHCSHFMPRRLRTAMTGSDSAQTSKTLV